MNDAPAYSGSCRYGNEPHTVAWRDEADAPTDGTGLIACDEHYHDVCGYGHDTADERTACEAERATAQQDAGR